MSCTKEDIGKRISELRKAKGFSSQNALAKKLNVDRGVVAKWENGSRELKPEYAVALADELGVSCDYILRNIEASNLEVHRMIGLSNRAINSLKKLVDESYDDYETYTDKCSIGRISFKQSKLEWLSEVICYIIERDLFSYHQKLCDVHRVMVELNNMTNEDYLCSDYYVYDETRMQSSRPSNKNEALQAKSEEHAFFYWKMSKCLQRILEDVYDDETRYKSEREWRNEQEI